VKNSYAMELEGLQRSLAFLMEENELPVSHLITDRHSSVKKYMRERHTDITNWFDVWHVAKGKFFQNNILTIVVFELNIFRSVQTYIQC
jgi:hypothetical protein